MQSSEFPVILERILDEEGELVVEILYHLVRISFCVVLNAGLFDPGIEVSLEIIEKLEPPEPFLLGQRF